MSDTWLTDPNLIAALGGSQSFDLDPCAAPDPRPWPTARAHIALPVNGLKRHWHGRIWLNPPYSDPAPWLALLARHNHGSALVFAKTDTTWFAESIWRKAAALLFLSGRVSFFQANGRLGSHSGARHPSVLIAYGHDDAERLFYADLPGTFRANLPPVSIWLLTQPERDHPQAADLPTWRALVQSVLSQGPATIGDIFQRLAGHPRAAENRHVRAKVRQTLARLNCSKDGDLFSLAT
jgi:hypothetical protein